jgi:hypothetical protein
MQYDLFVVRTRLEWRVTESFSCSVLILTCLLGGQNFLLLFILGMEFIKDACKKLRRVYKRH